MIIRPVQEHDRDAVKNLLAEESLPTDIVEENKGDLWVAEADGSVVGSGALEVYGQDALLRSVVVAPERKGRGEGTRMVDHLESEAARRGVKNLWLLTETAEPFFAGRGYEKVERSMIVNKGILDSAEFKHLCASTAVCMRKDLTVENRHSTIDNRQSKIENLNISA